MSTLSRCRSLFSYKFYTSIVNIGNSHAKMHILSGSKMLCSSVIRNNSALITKRGFSKTFSELFRRPKKAELKEIDNVPPEYHLIYRNTTYRYILVAQIITTFLVVVGVFFAVILPDFKNYQPKTSPQLHRVDTQTQQHIYLIAISFFLVILQMLVYKLPIRVYYFSSQKKYIYVFYGNCPFTHRKLACSVGDVMKLPQAASIMPWKEVRYMINNKQEVYLMENYFRRPADLYIMLGVQRDPEDDM